MAKLEVPCPGCKTVLKAPADAAGRKAQCKKCGAMFRIPKPHEAPQAAAADEEDVPEAMPACAGGTEPITALATVGKQNEVPIPATVKARRGRLPPQDRTRERAAAWSPARCALLEFGDAALEEAALGLGSREL